MAKINPLFGKLQGKLGGTVFAIRNGEQIMREYNPAPFNPRTENQLEARAKLKLISQLSAVMAPYIAMHRVGNVSTRNQFVKENYGAMSYSSEVASANLTDIKLTRSVVGLPQLTVTRGSNNSIIAAMATPISAESVSRIVYVAFVKQADQSLRFLSSAVATEEGDANWQVTLGASSLEVVVYAYGVRDNTESARVTFGNMVTITAEQVAKLTVNRTLTENDVTLTETVAYQLATASQQMNAEPEDGNRAAKKK